MPAIEADRDAHAYELAYHVLPTVAEGEVDDVTKALKAIIVAHGGEVFDEEVAERFELAYEIEKYLEGRYRRFSSAYFGWIRFRMSGDAVPTTTEEIEAHKQILRTLLVRLTKQEEANPFSFHEALAEIKNRVVTIDEEIVESEEPNSESVDTPATTDEEAEEVVK